MKRIFNIKLFKKKGQISVDEWNKLQKDHELAFWREPDKFEPLGKYRNWQEKYYSINVNMFSSLKLLFQDKIVCDVGCGPYLGFLPYVEAKIKLAIDPLLNEYNKIIKYKLFYDQNENIILLNVKAEKIPLVSNYVHACYCVNSLDHMQNPYAVLREMFRILKIDGYFALSVDINGTPKHPHKMSEKILDKFLLNGRFEIIEKKCSSDIESSWPKEMNIPLYIFQGIKKMNRI